MASAKIFRINYKSDFILTLESDAGWMTPFCIKFWTGAPSQAYYVSWDGETYDHCSFDPSEPTKLQVQFDDHHLPIGNLKYQVAYHFTVADFPNDTEDEVLNQANITTEIDGETYQVMLDFRGETAPEIEFSLPAYANEAQRIANEQQRITNEEQRIAAETVRIQNEQQRIAQEQIRQQNEQQRINQEQARVNEYAGLKADAVAATGAANDAAAQANQKAQLAADKAALAESAATLANQKAQLAADKAALANSAATLANQKAALAQQKAEYAQTQGDYAKTKGDYAKEQGDTALADHQRAEVDHGIAVDDHTQAGNDHTRAESDHGIAADDHTQAGNDHTRAESDHSIAVDDNTQAGNDHTRAESDHRIAADDHTQAGNDHTRAESDHTRAESDHAAVEVFVDSLGVFDLSKYNAVGGVLATYADLSAALTALNALDSKYKYGGMSFKFIRTYDNNSTQYVQYRYMSTSTAVADFTNVANWQGVDEEPTAASENLVKSGGVYDVTNSLHIQAEKLTDRLYGTEGGTIDLTNYDVHGGYIYQGVYRVTSASTNCYKIVEVQAGKKIKITANANYDGKYAFLKSYPTTVVNNVTPVDYCTGETSVRIVYKTIPVEITIPDDCTYMLVQVVNSSNLIEVASIEYLAENGDIPTIESDITDIKAQLEGSDDSAFDISAETGDSYANLGEALAAADTVIPTEKKKGGMSIKFIQLISAVYTVVKTEGLTEQPSGTEVQESLGLDTGTYTADQMGDISLPTSSTVGYTYWMAVSGDTITYTMWYICRISTDIQRYVQSRLLSTSWNTNVTNWQGVADEIVDGSVDLAKSGDVSAIISKLMPERIVGYANKNLFRGGYYHKTSGEYIVNSSYCSLKIDIPATAKYIAILNYRSGGYPDGVLFFDANDEYIQDSFVAGTTEFKSVRIPDGASKVAINAVFSNSYTLERIILLRTPLSDSDVEDETAFKTGELVKDVSIEQMPTSGSHNIVESGGVYKPISKLSDKIYGTEGSVIDLDDFESHNGYIVNGVYRTSDVTRNYKIVDVEAGKSIRITANANYDGKITFLKSYPDVIINNQTPADFCDGITGIITVYKTIPVETAVPDDCKYLYVLTLNGSGKDSTPSSIEYLSQPSIEEEIDNKIHSERIDNIGVSINVFGDVLPEQFKTKLAETNDDLLIACQGDSVTGRTQDCNPSPDATHDCPGGQYQSFVYLLQKNVGKVKPFYNRLDSQRDDADFFTKTGTWEQEASGDYEQGIPSAYEEASVTCLTFKSNDAGASIGFTFDADTYEKCNIIFSKVVNAGSMALSVQEGNGKLLASIDRVTWVEANGFNHSQELENRPTDTAGAVAFDKTGKALCQRHRRLWLKKADSTVTGTLNITYSKVGSDSNYVYCWGTEMYSGRGVFFDNIGRGGKSISALKKSISDIFDRNPDLTILEMPLANDTHYTTTNAELLGDDYYRGYFLDETNGYSYKVRSENYTKYPIIVVLPHTRGYAFDEDDNAVLYPEGYLRTAPAYDIYKMVWAYLRTNLKTYENVKFVDMCDQFLNEAKYRYGSYHNGISDGCMTYDTIHLNQRGADVYNKYLAPIFQV